MKNTNKINVEFSRIGEFNSKDLGDSIISNVKYNGKFTGISDDITNPYRQINLLEPINDEIPKVSYGLEDRILHIFLKYFLKEKLIFKAFLLK